MPRGISIVLVGALALAPEGAVAQSLNAKDLFDLGRAVLESSQSAGTPTPRQAPTTAAPRRDREQATVRDVQAGLNRLGYDAGPVDGLMGQKTRSAILGFERDNGLPATGRPSADLLARIRARADAPGAAPGAAPRAASATPRPSYDCAKASTAVEHAICNSVALADQDRRIADLYSSALAGARDPSAIRARQRSWIARRDRCGGAQDCLSRAMADRIAELSGQPAQATTATASATAPAAPKAGTAAAPTTETAPTAAATTTTTRPDGLRVTQDGRIVMPGGVLSKTSPGYVQLLAMRRLLRHAAAGRFLHKMVAPDDAGRLAEFARDYLPLDELRPYFCTRDEMQGRTTGDCMPFSDAIADFAMKGGTLGEPGYEGFRRNPFLWWRGATEFARRRSLQDFVKSGTYDRIASTAPKAPFRLRVIVGARLDAYDFDKGAFPVFAPDAIAVPGSRSAIKFPSDMKSLAMPPGAAEDTLKTLKAAHDGEPVVTLGLDVDLTPTGWDGVPAWDARVVSSGMYIDREATQPLAPATGNAGQKAAAAKAERPPAAPAGGPVLRDFGLKKEDGRILLGDGAVDYVAASAARDLVGLLRDKKQRRSPLPLIFGLLNTKTRQAYFGCDTVEACGGPSDLASFGGSTEFEQRRKRQAFLDAVPDALIAEAPTLPLRMRQYIDMNLGEYNFDKNGFPISLSTYNIRRLPGLGLELGLQDLYGKLPDFLEVPPDQAETMLNGSGGDLTARLDFDVVTFRVPRIFAGKLLTVYRMTDLAIVDAKNHGKVYFHRPGPAVAPIAANAAADLLGPIPAKIPAADQSTYPVSGVSLGMSRQAALDALSQSFAANEITADDSLIRAERGVCRYQPNAVAADEEGALCLVAALRQGKVVRILRREVLPTSSVSAYDDRMKADFGKPDARFDGATPDGTEGREFFGWGKALTADRRQLGRIALDHPPREAELDVLYATPQRSSLTLRVDPAVAEAGQAGPAPDAAASSAPAAPDAAPAVRKSAPSTPAGEAAKPLALVDVTLGMTADEAQKALAANFDPAGISWLQKDMLAAEEGPCHYRSIADPGLAGEAGSFCAHVLLDADRKVRSVYVRNVFAGSLAEQLVPVLEARFGPPAERITDPATGAIILGWGDVLPGPASILMRDDSAGQTLRALQGRLTEVSGVTLLTLRLDAQPPQESAPAAALPETKF